MNLRRWLSVILMMGLILALNSLSAQADPYGPYYHPPGHAYGWDGPRSHDFGHHYKHFRHSWRGPHHPRYVERVYGGPPAVAYPAPVAPVMGIPYVQPQPYFSQPSQPGPPGFHGQFNYNF
jgi:hypothetical protein